MGVPRNPIKIKVCGLTRSDQAVECVRLGADMIGINCWQGSPRYVSRKILREIVTSVGNSVETVAVFVNEKPEVVNRLVGEFKIDTAQLHGDETPNYTQQLKVSWFKAFQVTDSFRPKIIPDYKAKRFLLDAYSKSSYGGSGKTFDWEQAKRAVGYGHLILAGGLTPDNVADAVFKIRPYAVDVCSGVEIEPGIKNLHEVELYIQAVKKAATKLNGKPEEDGSLAAETLP